MYHTVFEISDRYPDAIMCLLAVASILPIGVIALRRSWRERLWTASCLALLWGGILWVALSVHAMAGPQGSEAGLVGAGFALTFAWSVGIDTDRLFGLGKKGPRFRTIGPFLAAGAFALVGAVGSPYLASFDLARQASEGQASVVEGSVHDVGSAPGGGHKPFLECFSVGTNRYCYDNIGSVGFHQTADNGGPIRNGLEVRVTSIGGVIVRLEVAGGQ